MPTQKPLREDFNTLTFSYGDRHYSMRFDGPAFDEERMKHHVMSYVYKALIEYHETTEPRHRELAKVRMELHSLAADIPEVAQRLRRSKHL